MPRRLFCPLLAAAMFAMALSGMVQPASGAIRITISDGVNPTKVFYASSADSFGSLSATFTTTIGQYELLVATTGSNFPGSITHGSLAQSVLVYDLSTGGGILPQLTVSTAIIADVGVATGQVTNATDIASVLGAGLLQFTLPSSTNLSVTTAVTSVGSTQLGGVVAYTSSVNNQMNTVAIPVDTTQAQSTAPVTNLPGGYTLASQLSLTGAMVGTNGLVIGGSTAVFGAPEPGPDIPEPASMLVWGLGAIGLVAAGRRYRLSKKAE